MGNLGFNDKRASRRALLFSLKLIPPPRARPLNLFAWFFQRRSPVASKLSRRQRFCSAAALMISLWRPMGDPPFCLPMKRRGPERAVCRPATLAKPKTRPASHANGLARFLRGVPLSLIASTSLRGANGSLICGQLQSDHFLQLSVYCLPTFDLCRIVVLS